MSHLNIYIPDALEKQLKKEAKRQRLSLSAYFAGLIGRNKTAEAWDKNFLKKAIGGWKGEFVAPKRELADEVEDL